MGNVVVVCLVRFECIVSNFDVFDFELVVEYMDVLGGFNDGIWVCEDLLIYVGI